MGTTGLRNGAIVAFIVGMAILLVGGHFANRQAPPIPKRVVSGETELTNYETILRGQDVYQRYGLMDHGSVWGHGSLRGMDFSADTLHRVGQAMRDFTVAGERTPSRFQLIVQQREMKKTMASVLDDNLAAQIAKVRGVTRVDPWLSDAVEIEQAGRAAVLVQGVEAGSAFMAELNILPGGRRLAPEDARRVLLGERLAASLEKRVGDKLTVFDSEPYTVAGIFKSPTVYESGSMIVLLKDLQKFMGRQGRVNGYTVAIDRPDDRARTERIRRDIEALARDFVVESVYIGPATRRGAYKKLSLNFAVRSTCR